MNKLELKKFSYLFLSVFLNYKYFDYLKSYFIIISQPKTTRLNLGCSM